MKLKSSSNFLFAVCQCGAEGALKKEVARGYPQLKFAYSRPGFLTFKYISPDPLNPGLPFDFEFKSVFARAYGVSLGQLHGTDSSFDAEITALSQELTGSNFQKRVRYHLWERDFHPPGEEPLGFVRGALAAALKPLFFSDSAVAEVGDLVLDLIVLEKEEVWVGAHLHSASHSPYPGAQPPVLLPSEAPSRAYLKLEESLLWSGAPLRAGDTAVEIGSAPGGASFALLQRGLKVVGIDPAQMDPRVLKNPLFEHRQQTVNSILRESLPESIQWLLLDMNVEPRITLFSVDRLVLRMMDSLLGVLLTIKLNQWHIAEEIPEMIEHVRAMGMTRVKAVQLYSHRQEILIYGLTRKGVARSTLRGKGNLAF